MTIIEGLRSHLLADPAIAAVVAARIYPLRLPQKHTLPAIVINKISGERVQPLRGRSSLAHPRIQVDAWASAHDAAASLGGICRQRLEGFNGIWSDAATSITVAVIFDSEMDLFDEDISGGLCRHSADYFVFHSTENGTV